MNTDHKKELDYYHFTVYETDEAPHITNNRIVAGKLMLNKFNANSK